MIRKIVCATMILSPLACKNSANVASSQKPAAEETIKPSIPVKVAFATYTLLQGVGACGEVYVQIQDNDGLAASPAKAATIALATSASTGAFYSDNACLTKTTSISIPTDGYEATVYYKDGALGSPSLTLTETSGLGLAAGSQAMTIAEVAKLAFLGLDAGLPQSTADCAAGAVETQTSDGNPVSVSSPVTISLSSSTSTGGFFSDSGCSASINSITIESSHYESAAFFYKDSTVGSATLSATDAPQQKWTKASVSLSITAP